MFNGPVQRLTRSQDFGHEGSNEDLSQTWDDSLREGEGDKAEKAKDGDDEEDVSEKSQETTMVVDHVGSPTAATRHRSFCEKCHESEIGSGGEDWETCLGCSVAAHWSCLAEFQQQEVAQSSFVCDACTIGGFCIGCEAAIEAIHIPTRTKPLAFAEILFRCFSCKRPAHYSHLPTPPSADLDAVAKLYRNHPQWLQWLCADCFSFRYLPEKILAWRPSPPNVLESRKTELPTTKLPLPREYLVKWTGRSYRRTSWVPHLWFQCASSAKLQEFIRGGATNAQYLADPQYWAPLPDPHAEQKIPSGWTEAERVLDIMMWRPGQPSPAQLVATLTKGQHPGSAMISLGQWEWEYNAAKKFTIADAEQVAWALIKWQDLDYDDATWDSPPESPTSDLRFQTALLRFIASREVIHPLPNIAARLRKTKIYQPISNPSVVTDKPALRLMSYQIEGVNWLGRRWCEGHQSVLADDMGLGKTVQIAVFVNSIIQQFQVMPVLVVAPNSTITNWVREFEKWAPELRVVSFNGNAESKQIIKDYELEHNREAVGPVKLKYHVLLTSYEGITGKDFRAVFALHRWEVLIIDEAQRLKAKTSELRKRLKTLDSRHRIIMTGTPMNNTVDELLNLMVFLDPDAWTVTEQALTEDAVQNLREKLRPYFLRRTKDEVLTLPPKSETEILVSMTTLQKQIYETILRYAVDGRSEKYLTEKDRPKPRNVLMEPAGQAIKGRPRNVLMELRKTLQHPFLCVPEAEIVHSNLVATSGKFVLLKLLLKELRLRERRVLLFSQFVIVLNMIEDFLEGEGYTFLRLDGETDGADRRRDIDEFNQSGSDIFIFILTTRAGGVGINLFTADTVIIFDPDFNPQLDNQAIARAYRHGQTKTCLVFTLIVKNSVEERIMENRRKKIILDDIIVQRMNATDSDLSNDDVEILLDYHSTRVRDDAGDAETLYAADKITEIVDQAIAKAENQSEIAI
ncbi:SNF2 family N-terminal domain-containing protein [Mycena crocata]|nr:SNF2 family N-terminal domain-containing protein [Mycena crocata]